MRPINKGDWPQEIGNNIDFTKYGQARPFLIDRIGDYCSYCETQITNPAVEHAQPKSEAPGIELNWYNFLLACVNCNTAKAHAYRNLNEYYWPDVHNTHLLFDFHPLGIVKLKNTYLANIDQQRVLNTYKLTGIDRYGSTANNGDRRWNKRSQAWSMADESLAFYEAGNCQTGFIKCITNNALSSGFWSVWMKVFEDHTEVQDALLEVFKGTFSGCGVTDINRL